MKNNYTHYPLSSFSRFVLAASFLSILAVTGACGSFTPPTISLPTQGGEPGSVTPPAGNANVPLASNPNTSDPNVPSSSNGGGSRPAAFHACGASNANGLCAETLFATYANNALGTVYAIDNKAISLDGGVTWTANPNGDSSCMAWFVTSDANILYGLCSRDVPGTKNSIDTLSTSHDRGATWVRMKDNVMPIGVDPKSPAIVYAASTVYDGATVTRSQDFGQTFVPFSDLSSDQITRVVVSPNDSNSVYVSADSNQLAVTHDGGATWAKSTAPWFDTMDVTDPNHLFGTDAGLYESSDDGATWTLRQADAVSVVVPEWDTSSVYINTNKSQTLRSTDGGLHWEDITGSGSTCPNANFLIDTALRSIVRECVYVLTPEPHL